GAVLRPVRGAWRPAGPRGRSAVGGGAGPPARGGERRVRDEAREPTAGGGALAAAAHGSVAAVGPRPAGADRRHGGAVQAPGPDPRPEVPRDNCRRGGTGRGVNSLAASWPSAVPRVDRGAPPRRPPQASAPATDSTDQPLHPSKKWVREASG